jgi:hypothetical protein
MKVVVNLRLTPTAKEHRTALLDMLGRSNAAV